MKNKLFGKRIIVAIIVVCMYFTSFAAVVGDNDGAAFVTKAEFDALKKDFSSQIDKYNDSINDKLDGAIAAYLAGRANKKEQTPLLVSNWDSVVELNGALKQKYDYPSVDGSVVICQKIIECDNTPTNLMNTKNMTTNNDWWKQIWCVTKTTYNNSTPNSTRNLVGNVVIGETPDKSNMVWKGHANRAKELWTLSIVRIYTNNPGNMITDGTNNLFQICEYLNLIRDGYITSFIDKDNPIWKPSVRWRGNSSDTNWYNWGYGTTYAISSIPTVTYEKDSSGKVKSYEHIITHKSSDSWELCAENVTNYLNFSSENTCKTATWTTKTTNSGKWNGCEFAFVKSTTASKNININALQIDKSVAWTDNTYTGSTNNKNIPVIGLLSASTSGSIYQFDDDDLKDADGVSVVKRKLHEGLPIMKVSEDEIVEWTPQFKDIVVDGVSGVSECKIKLSYVPFTNEGTVSDTKDLVKMDGVTLNEWAKTSGKKVSIKFEADRSGYIYAKWVPDTTDTNISNKAWEVTLDIKNCSNYLSSKG